MVADNTKKLYKYVSGYEAEKGNKESTEALNKIRPQASKLKGMFLYFSVVNAKQNLLFIIQLSNNFRTSHRIAKGN